MSVIDEWHSAVDLKITPPALKGTKKKRFEVVASDFAPPLSAKGKNESYLIIGFDTEFKAPDYRLTRDEIVEFGGKYTVVSYQYHCILSDGTEWNGICCPDKGERISLNDFLIFSIADGARNHDIKNIPTNIYIVGHFTRADIPAFSDFKDLQQYLASVRSTFVSIDSGKQANVKFSDGSHNLINIRFRDTMLLTPQTSRHLAGIGDLLGVPKLRLGGSDKEHANLIKSMDKTVNTHWDSFKAYAIQDAAICAKYLKNICDLYSEITGDHKVPNTLSSIGIDLLLKKWNSISPKAELKFLGLEIVNVKTFNKSKNKYDFSKRRVPIAQVHLRIPLVTETYHGGRNEQFWFGPCFEDDWSDFDLSSAYPTAMSIIGEPDWESIRFSTKIDDYTPETLGYCWIKFKFPESVRYPSIPVRTDNGIVFPLEGIANCAAPEIALAKSLGAKIKIIEGWIVPTDQNHKIFGEFIKECIDKRNQAGSKSLKGLFWKEISNSTYGKTAQGLKEKRVYDMRVMDTKPLPPSPITNSFFASFITSFVRAVLGEIMNSLPESRLVFSCTTDGFLTNASEAEVIKASNGLLLKTYKSARKALVGNEDSIEIKHKIRKPLGWRTRGQATLINGKNPKQPEDFSVVLAKGGIYTPAEYDSDLLQNDLITKMFFERYPGQVIHFGVLTGVRDIVEHDSDLVEKSVTKSLGMEFDWKRCPHGIGESKTHKHVLFSTKPWKTVDQFFAVRASWLDYTRDQKKCIKSRDDLDKFANYVEISGMRNTPKGKYLKKEKGDINRLRQLLCSAWRQHKAGLNPIHYKLLSNEQFAAALSEHGVPCKRADVENGKRRAYQQNSCPATEQVLKTLQVLKKVFPTLDCDDLLYKEMDPNAVSLRGSSGCQFISRCS